MIGPRNKLSSPEKVFVSSKLVISSSFGGSYFSLTSLGLNTSEKEFRELKKKTKACEKYLQMWNFILIFCYLVAIYIPQLQLLKSSLLPISGFVLDEKFQQNASKFAFRATTIFVSLMNTLVNVNIDQGIH